MEMKASREADTKKDDDSSANLIVVPAMLSLLRTGGTFLATYASAALVNLSSGNQAVKMLLMGQGMAKLAVQNMQAKEDDLSYYTLMLMVNLTKEPHNRSVIASAGLIPILYDIMTSSYAQVRPTGKKAQGISTAALGSNRQGTAAHSNLHCDRPILQRRPLPGAVYRLLSALAFSAIAEEGGVASIQISNGCRRRFLLPLNLAVEHCDRCRTGHDGKRALALPVWKKWRAR